MLWIRIGFNADLDLAFYLNADPDPDLGQTFKSQKMNFYIKKYSLKVLSSEMDPVEIRLIR